MLRFSFILRTHDEMSPLLDDPRHNWTVGMLPRLRIPAPRRHEWGRIQDCFSFSFLHTKSLEKIRVTSGRWFCGGVVCASLDAQESGKHGSSGILGCRARNETPLQLAEPAIQPIVDSKRHRDSSSTNSSTLCNWLGWFVMHILLGAPFRKPATLWRRGGEEDACQRAGLGWFVMASHAFSNRLLHAAWLGV